MQTLCRLCRWTIVAPVILALGLLAMIGGCSSIESDVKSRAEAALVSAGVAGVEVSEVSYRDVTLSGPADIQASAVAAVDGLSATRTVSFEGTQAVVGETPATTTTLPAAPAAPVLALQGSISNGAIVLSGVVPDEATRQEILAAAEAAYGAANVTDQMTVDEVAASDEQAGAAADLAGLIAAFPDRLNSGEFTLDDTALAIQGEAPSGETVDELDSFFAAATTLSVDAEIGFATETEPVTDNLAELLALQVINFESGSSEITADQLAEVEEVLALLAPAFEANPGLRVEVAGHTDSQGSAGLNLALSQARAEAVRGILVEGGLPADGLTAVGYGEDQPIADNATDDGRAANRRIEFTILEG